MLKINSDRASIARKLLLHPKILVRSLVNKILGSPTTSPSTEPETLTALEELERDIRVTLQNTLIKLSDWEGDRPWFLICKNQDIIIQIEVDIEDNAYSEPETIFQTILGILLHHFRESKYDLYFVDIHDETIMAQEIIDMLVTTSPSLSIKQLSVQITLYLMGKINSTLESYRQYTMNSISPRVDQL